MSKIGNFPHSQNTLKANLFLVVGDPFLRAQRSKAIAAEIEKKNGSPLNHQIFHLEETGLEEILTVARTLPFFSSGQILYVHEADLLKETDFPVLAAYLENSLSQTILILQADELKTGSELQKLVKSQGQVILLGREDAQSAGVTFLQQKLAQRKKTMTSGARARIFAMCGDAMVFLDTILERLVQFAGEKNEITEAMVSQFEENWTEMDVFKLTNAFVDRDPARVIKIFRDLMEFYEADLISIVGILHWQLRQLWQAALLLEQGTSEREICSKLRMPPFRLNALKKFPLKRLEASLEALYQIDKKAKTGQLEGISGVEAWLLQYAS